MTWPLVPIEECARIVSGATPSTTVPDYWDGDICWATPKDLSELESHYIDETPRKITPEGLASCGAEVLPAYSVLFSSRAPIGHVAVNRAPMATNQGFKSFVPNPEKLDPKFLYHWLRANRRYLESLGNGATFKEVSKAVIARLKLPLPPLEEQQRIAAILDAADALRAKRRAALAKLDILAQSIFIEMFGDPNFNPRNFAKKALAELIHVKSGNGLVAANMAENGIYPVYGGNGINGYHDEYMFAEPKIVIGRVGVYCGAIHITEPNAWVTDNALFVSECSRDLNQTYLAFALRMANLNQYAGRAAQPLVSGSRIYPVEILVPELELQTQFSATLRELDSTKTPFALSASRIENLFMCLQHRAFLGGL